MTLGSQRYYLSRLEIPKVVGWGLQVHSHSGTIKLGEEEDKRDGEPLDRGSGIGPESRQMVRRAGLDPLVVVR